MSERPRPPFNDRGFVDQYQSLVQGIHTPQDIDLVSGFARERWFRRRAQHDPLLLYSPFKGRVPATLEAGIRSKDVTPETIGAAAWEASLRRYHGTTANLRGRVNYIATHQLPFRAGNFDTTTPLSFVVTADLIGDNGTAEFEFNNEYILALGSLTELQLKTSVLEFAQGQYTIREILSKKILYLFSRISNRQDYNAYIGRLWEKHKESHPTDFSYV